MLVTKVVMPESKYSIKCPYKMNVEGITIHNTANDASAMAEISYMIGNNKQVSFHEAIDDYRVVQGIDHNRNSWNSGDGANGFGNRKTIAIEICYSRSGGERFEKAEKNAAERIAYLMKKYNLDINAIEDKRVGTHQNRSGKYCPHRTLDYGINRFYNMIKIEYNKIIGNDSSKNTINRDRTAGDIVKINGVYTSSSSDNKLNPAIKSGTITKILVGAKNPYLLNGGNLGWVNDSCIIDTEVKKENKIDRNEHVILLNTADRYATGQVIPFKLKNRIYTVYQVENDKVLLKELWSWAYKKDVKETNNNSDFKINQRVTLLNTANRYVTGQVIPASIKNKSYTIMQINNDRVLLKEIYSWVWKKDII